MKILIEKEVIEDIGEAAYRLALSYKSFSISKEQYMEKFSELLHTALREALAEQAEQEPICCTYPKCNCINPTLCRAQNITAEQAAGAIVKTCPDGYGTITTEQAEQEPVAIGSEWKPCMKLPVVVHVREQREGESHVSTREGITPVRPDDLIMRGVAGEEYPIGRELFNKTYTFDTAAPVRTKDLTDDEIDVLIKQFKFVGMTDRNMDFARAVIAADREKNK